MSEMAAIALELLEYKVEDLRASRPVKGGSESAWELQRTLAAFAGDLDPEGRRRFDQLSRELGVPAGADTRSASSRQAAAVRPGIDELVLGGGLEGASEERDEGSIVVLGGDEEEEASAATSAWTPEERDERQALQRLAQRVWRRDVKVFAESTAAAWRAERDRTSARLIYATMRNLEHHRQRDVYARDPNLRQFKVRHPLPPRIDPLLSMSDVDSLANLVQEVVDAVVQLRDQDPAPDIQRNESLDYLRRLAASVARDPYAGRLSPMEGAGLSASELRAALRDLGRERLPEWQRHARRQELEHQLAERQALERQQRQLFQRDVLRFTELVQLFFDRLAKILPRRYGGQADDPQLRTGVLFAVSPALRRESVPPEAEAVTLRLKGPVRFTFLGMETVVGVDGDRRRVHVGGEAVQLEGQDEIEVGGHPIEAFLEGDYLHLRHRGGGRSLAARAAEAAAILYVLTSSEREPWLAALKLLVNGGSAEPKTLVLEAIRRCGEITSRAPDRRGALERLIQGAARAIGAELPEAQVLGLVQRIHLALTVGPQQLEEALFLLADHDPAAEAIQVVSFGGDPVDVDVGGRKVTIRSYGARAADHLVAMLPGQVIGSFRDHLIEHLSSGTLVCVHGDQQLAVGYLPHLTLSRAGTA